MKGEGGYGCKGQKWTRGTIMDRIGEGRVNSKEETRVNGRRQIGRM